MEEEDPENTEVRHSSWMYLLDPQLKMVKRGEDHKLIRQKEWKDGKLWERLLDHLRKRMKEEDMKTLVSSVLPHKKKILEDKIAEDKFLSSIDQKNLHYTWMNEV